MEIQDRIDRIKWEMCRLDVKYDAGKYKGIEDSYFEIKAILRNRVEELKQKKVAAA